MEDWADSGRNTKLETTFANRAKLFVIYDGNTLEYDLREYSQLIMGRKARDFTPDLQVNSPIVSRRHGMFRLSEGVLTYQDLGSTNGTFINGIKAEKAVPVPVYDGSVFRVHPVNNADSSHDVVMLVTATFPADVRWERVSLGNEVMSLDVGRNQEIALRGKTVSRKHATFFHAQNGWAIIDNHSLNGVFLNGRKIREPVLLRPMDLVLIAHHIFLFEGESLLYQADRGLAENQYAADKYPAADKAAGKVPADEIPAADKPAEKVPADQIPAADNPAGMMPADPWAAANRPAGKAPAENHPEPGKSAELQSPEVMPDEGKRSGRAGRGKGMPTPEQGGKAVSGKRRKAASGGRMLSIHIEERNAWNRLRKKTLLRDIDLRIESGSLVLILGGSGAGKTTFMNAVMGYEPAKGKIAYGKSDIYREYEKMKYEIGYVPQQDLLRMEDVVYETLDNAAQMRLPDSVGAAERARRVENALQMFGLSRERDAIVAKLSGGQRKRLSIAVEYIGNPSLFFLDEPDSGLDGIMAKELMMNLRQIADQKKIVMVISHAPDRAFELFDKVIVLAKSDRDDSGHLVYYGSPADACRFFGTETLEGIVGRINRKDEGGEGLADYFIEQYKQSGGIR